MNDITLAQAVDWVAHFCLIFSILNALLPPYDVLDDFPEAQRYYKLLLGIVSYFAFDMRSKVIALYPSFNRSISGVAMKEQKVEDMKQEVVALKKEIIAVEGPETTKEKKE